MTPYWRVNEVPLPRVACGMISSAVLVQLNGWQSVFQLSMNLVIALMRSVTELNAPRRIACRVMMPKKISTMLSQDPEVGVKCMVTRGFCASQALTLVCLLRGVVVDHQVQLDPWIGLRDLLEEPQELIRAVSRQAGLGDLPGGHLQGGEQGGGAVPHVVMGPLLRQVRSHRQDRRGPVQRLDLAFFVDREHHGLLRRVKVETNDVTDLGLQ